MLIKLSNISAIDLAYFYPIIENQDRNNILLNEY